MNLLIVDDEVYAVRAIQKSIQWDLIGIDEVYTAFNVTQAKTHLQENIIDIVITDIEMPGESGLDLLRWITEQEYQCKLICLTCHREFNYAQAALRYRVMDYVVKPINFQKIIQVVSTAVAKIKEEQIQKSWQDKGVLWDINKEKLENVFWEEILNGIPDGIKPTFSGDKKNKPADYDEFAKYSLILFAIRRLGADRNERRRQLEQIHYILSDIFYDVFLEGNLSGKCGWKDSCFWVILPEQSEEAIRERLDNFIDMCEHLTGVGLVGYTDEACLGKELPQVYRRLQEANKQNVSCNQGIVNIRNPQRYEDNIFYKEFVGIVHQMLEAGKLEQLKAHIDTVKQEKMVVEKRAFFLMVENTKQEIFTFLHRHHIEQERFWTEELQELNIEIYHSAERFMAWLTMAVEQLMLCYGNEKNELIVIRQIQGYIEEHVEERISRDQIAKCINFSTDYISRLFRKEVGMSLSEYIMERKIERAKLLIDSGNENIGNIAIRLGYSNISYFSEIFKRRTGVLPSDYKKKK